MTSYAVTCETCPHRSVHPTHEAAIADAEGHAKTHPDHSVIVERQPDEEEPAPA